NHGGRQLDSCVAPIEGLPEIVAGAGARPAGIVDSGFRGRTRGGKGWAPGAQAVMVGRAALYGLIAGGEPGVERALAILESEIDRVLGQLGCKSIADLRPELIRRV